MKIEIHYTADDFREAAYRDCMDYVNDSLKRGHMAITKLDRRDTHLSQLN